MAETTVLRSSGSPRQTAPRGSKPGVTLSGKHGTVNVVMGSGGKPIVQGKDSNTHQAPNVVILPPKGRRSGVIVHPVPTVIAGPSPLSTEQLMLCRHLVTAYLDSPEVSIENVTIGAATLQAIDQALGVGVDAVVDGPSAAAVVPQARPPVVVTGPRSQAQTASAPRRIVRAGASTTPSVASRGESTPEG